MLTSCGDPENILSVGTTYVVGIGGPCSSYSEWTPYSQYPPEHRQALLNRCSNSTASTIMPSVTIVSSIVVTTFVHATPTPQIITPSTVIATSISAIPTFQVIDDDSGTSIIFPSNITFMATVMFLWYFL